LNLAGKFGQPIGAARDQHDQDALLAQHPCGSRADT
jgi:hypothetical protein